MDSAKKESLAKGIIFLFLVLFPFGQLFRFNLNLGRLDIPFQPIDLIAICALIFTFFLKPKVPKAIRGFKNFLIIAFFSLALSFTFFDKEILKAGLYFLRLMAYSVLFFVSLEFVKNNHKTKLTLFNSLITISFFSGLFGWIQYFIFPDFRPFTVWGWDDHLYRLIATFLDPGFTGLILVFGFLASIVKAFERNEKKLFFLPLFFILTFAFTYSRASYLAFLAGLFVILHFHKKLKFFLFFLIAFVLLLLILPRPSGEGVKLERLFSVFSRLDNYQEGILLWKESPVFGLGYNNLCLAKEKYLGTADEKSHSCSGFDSSLLLILVTTGVAGLLIFLEFLLSLWRKTSNRLYGLVFKSSLMALFIHSLFVNSLFYPWVVGWTAILLSLDLSKSKEKNEE